MTKSISHKQKLVNLFGNCTDCLILDYGCGRGDFIELFMCKGNQPKQIVVADSDEKMLTQITEDYQKLIQEEIIIPKIVKRPQDLINNKYDKIICHNVLECIDDKLEFINGFKDLLNPGGLFILSHHDFDSAIYNSNWKQLTRNLIHHFADTQQAWQEHCDGQMGRKIPALIAQSEFKDTTVCETWRIVEQDFTPESYGFLMANMLIDVGRKTFQQSEIQEWYADLQHQAQLKNYYFAIDLVVAKIEG